MIKLRVKDAGFTLLEVAIAMGVLAIGLLGLASLQAVTIKSNASISYRSQATNLAHSIIDAMRVNKTTFYATAIESNPECSQSLDLSGDIIQNYIDAWKNTLACVLPQGTGSIVIDANNVVTVVVQWDSSRSQTQAEQVNGYDPLEKIEVITRL